MGRTIKDSHDLDDNIGGADELDDEDAELANLLETVDIDELPLRQTRKRGSGKKKVRNHDYFPTDLKDWHDPEDDIMFGFKE